MALARPVVDRPGGEAAVGDYDGLVVGGAHHGVENLNLAHSAGIALGLDVIAYLIRFEEEYEHAAGEILQGTAQSHAYGNAGRGKDGYEARRLDAENADHNDYEDEIEHYPHHAKHEGGERAVDVATYENTAHKTV